jgi:hypothetical protein
MLELYLKFEKFINKNEIFNGNRISKRVKAKFQKERQESLFYELSPIFNIFNEQERPFYNNEDQ